MDDPSKLPDIIHQVKAEVDVTVKYPDTEDHIKVPVTVENKQIMMLMNQQQMV